MTGRGKQLACLRPKMINICLTALTGLLINTLKLICLIRSIKREKQINTFVDQVLNYLSGAQLAPGVDIILPTTLDDTMP